MRSHIALMSVPLHGHVNPMLGVAAELVDRGHRVTFASGAAFAPLIAETGATPVTYLSTFPVGGAPGDGWLAASDDGRQAARMFGRERDAALPQIAAAYGDDRPDLVVHDTVTAYGPMLADRWGVPQVQFSPTHVFFHDAEKRIGAPVRVVPDVGPCVVAMPRSLQINAEQVGPEHLFVGPVPWRRRTDGDWTAPAGKRVALVSLGTTYNTRTDVLIRCAEGLSAGGWHVVIATGDADGARELSGLPGSVEVHRWVPQVRVLEQAEVFVTAGGAGSALEGLTQGVPLVVVPQGVEQFLTAARVQALGVGRAITPERFSAEAIRTAAEELTTNPGTRAALEAMRAEIARSGGAPVAADFIETHLQEGSAV